MNEVLKSLFLPLNKVILVVDTKGCILQTDHGLHCECSQILSYWPVTNFQVQTERDFNAGTDHPLQGGWSLCL